MSYPLSSEKDGIKIKTELMLPDQLYHCIFQNKVMLVYKDQNEILNCYEIEEEEIVLKVKESKLSIINTFNYLYLIFLI
mgnify:CR=1 FL=1